MREKVDLDILHDAEAAYQIRKDLKTKGSRG